MSRAKIPAEVQEAVLVACRRRCAMCWGLHRDFDVKQGQIAHIDRDNANAAEANLVFLCLAHHDAYDTKTSQSKGWTQGEVVQFKASLHAEVATRWTDGSQAQPLLQLALLQPLGGDAPWTTFANGMPVHQTRARFFHLEVSNAHRAYPATSVRVYLTRLDRVTPDGGVDPLWHGESGGARLRWRNETEDPEARTPRTIGAPQDLDLCYLEQSPWEQPLAPRLLLRVNYPPANLTPHMRLQPNTPVVLHVQARSDQTESEVLRVKLAWTGQWAGDDAGAARILSRDIWG